MTKSVVIALILFLVFYCIGFSIKLVKNQAKLKNQWISREVHEKLTREVAT